MAGLPKNFDAISPVLANYDFVDIVSGTGYVNFYTGKTVDLKVLSNFSFFSDTVLTSYNVVTTVPRTLVIDDDFDVLLNRPMDLKGLGVVNIPVYAERTAGAGNVVMDVVVILRKWTGAVETDIVSNTSRILTKTTADYEMLAVDLNIPLTHFKIGEYIRLTINVYANTDAGTNGTVAYAHDPKNRTDGWDATGAVPSQLIFQCPVRLNL